MITTTFEDTLNLGCGPNRIGGAVNVDREPAVRPDVLHDLNRLPWPFADDAFDCVKAFDVIEHLDDVVATMMEIHRVCRHGARIEITVPHFSSCNAFTDPTHARSLGWSSFHYFTGEAPINYGIACRFERKVANLIFHPSIANKVVSRLANRWPERYERRWAWVFPAWFLYFELRAVKDR
jgi:SAM-dependent methyltransferase